MRDDLKMKKKEKIRRELLQQRKEMTKGQVATLSAGISEQIRSLEEWQRAKEVLLYWPIMNEVDTRPLISELWQRGVRVLLPRCKPGQPGMMDLVCVTCEQELAAGMYSIMEPVAGCEVIDVGAENFRPDLAILPGISFDRQGFRMGYGGGYYDRLLEGPQMGRALKVGLCYEHLFVKKLPKEAWDRPVNTICTEEQTWHR
jgi:5-formyltetrahydrofolate cyclo-ligase